MRNIDKLYNAVYKKHLKACIDTCNSIHKDVENIMLGKPVHNQSFADIISLLEKKSDAELTDDIIENIENGILKDLYFEENNIEINADSANAISQMRQITDIQFNDNPITNPYRQVIITSNILLTLPKDYDKFEFDEKSLINMNEAQENWYDHPIPLDIDDSSNEIIYGLTNLCKSIQIETNERVTIILSVSVTHQSLNKIAKKYITSKLYDKDTSNLDIYIFTEDDCRQITKTINENDSDLQDTLGVQGRYGRHYSFLKAITALYQQVIDNKVLATFKIDLDQVFPQKELKEFTEQYAFENFKSKRWGAKGVDRNGNTVRFSMAAGGLVNESDIDSYLFTPDVKKPDNNLNIEQLFFNSTKPQYISTVGEICAQYKDAYECIMRYHITGGMNGILINDLIKFRPFTPSFLTRAEDQAYILSVINKPIDGEYMRCVHLDKFVMRHDKEAFLSEDLKQYEAPKKVGDFERMLIYSHYSYDILNCGDTIKSELYPFTGCFVIKRPYTAVLLRFIAKLLVMDEEQGAVFLESFVLRMTNLIKDIDNNVLRDTYFMEKSAYDRYYDALSAGIDENVKAKLKNIFEMTRVPC